MAGLVVEQNNEDLMFFIGMVCAVLISLSLIFTIFSDRGKQLVLGLLLTLSFITAFITAFNCAHPDRVSTGSLADALSENYGVTLKTDEEWIEIGEDFIVETVEGHKVVALSEADDILVPIVQSSELPFELPTVNN